MDSRYIFPPIATVVTVASICYFTVRIWLLHAQYFHQYPLIRKTVLLLVLYPLGLLIGWTPVIVFVLCAFLGIDTKAASFSVGVIASFAFGSLYGLFLSVTFFATSAEARVRWGAMVCGAHPRSSNAETDFEVDSDDLLLPGSKPRPSDGRAYKSNNNYYNNTDPTSTTTSTATTVAFTAAPPRIGVREMDMASLERADASCLSESLSDATPLSVSVDHVSFPCSTGNPLRFNSADSASSVGSI